MKVSIERRTEYRKWIIVEAESIDEAVENLNAGKYSEQMDKEDTTASQYVSVRKYELEDE